MAYRAKKRSNRSIRIVVYENHVLKLFVFEETRWKCEERGRQSQGRKHHNTSSWRLDEDDMCKLCTSYYIYFKYMYSSIYYERKRKLFFFFTREEVQMLRIILFLSHHKQFHDINANKHTSTPRSIISPYYTIVRTKLYVLYKTLCAQNTFVI